MGLALVCALLAAPFAGSAIAYPATTCSTLSVSTTTPQAGASFTISGSNFEPSAAVHLVLRPAGSDLGTAQTDTTGAFSITAQIPADVSGNQNVVATSGATINGVCPADPVQSLAVQAASNNNGNGNNGSNGNGNGSGLSNTGLDVAGLLALAAALIVGGVAFNRRRVGAGR